MNGFYLEVAAVVPVFSGASRVELEELGSAMAKEINENKNAIAKEVQRAEKAEKGIAGDLNALATDIEELQGGISNVKNQAARFDGNAFLATANEVKLTTTGVNISNQWTVSLPAVTPEKAGVMTAEDKKVLKNLFEEAIKIDTLEVEELGDGIGINYGTFDGNGGSIEIPFATEEKAGVMSAVDKVALDTATSRALRALFIAADAEYNDTDEVIIQQPTYCVGWGETIEHKPKCYMLNGIGDITEAEMLNIYTHGYFVEGMHAPLAYNTNRTNLGRIGMSNSVQGCARLAYENGSTHISLMRRKHEGTFSMKSNEYFFNAKALKCIYGLLEITSYYDKAFYNCIKLERVKIKGLKANVNLGYSPMLSSKSVLYMIQNATPTSAITITLHADAYARLNPDLEENADIKSALEAQPLITLASA